LRQLPRAGNIRKRTPLAYALKTHLPEAEIVIFRERVTSTPLEQFGSPEIKEYAQTLANTYLK
jgi:hypothetical protein